MVSEKHHTRTWLIIYIVFPMMPFLLGGGIRLMTLNNLSWTTFSASDLAICLALLSLFVNQSLARSARLLDNEDKKAETELQALVFLGLAFIFLIFFALIVSFGAEVYDLKLDMLKNSLRICEIITFASLLPILSFSIKTQQSFRLRANIW